jgi:hypothetical protein
VASAFLWLLMNSLFLRRQTKIFLENGDSTQGEAVVAALLKNLEAFGYTLSGALIERVRTLSDEQIGALYRELETTLRSMLGARRTFSPMYPNFPQQVMEMSEAQLYLNAIVHYLTGLRPFTIKLPRGKAEDVQLQIIEPGTRDGFEAIFTAICASKTSISPQDHEDLAWFVGRYSEDIARLLPDEIPLKENRAIVGALLLRAGLSCAGEYLRAQCSTATDVLRLCVALSDGDVSLAKASKFGALSRPLRREILGLLENCGSLEEDLRRHKMRWIRLAERLHVGEYGAQFPRSARAFDTLRNGKIETFSSKVERQIERCDVFAVLSMLRSRPGELARRLDHLLRIEIASADAILGTFESVAGEVSTPVLLQVKAHFGSRNSGATLRTFFPKGQVAKVAAVENTLPTLSPDVCARVGAICDAALIARFRLLPPLGECFLDPRLRDFLVPFSSRSAAKALRTLVRGSKLPLPDADTLRFFIWWKNGVQRTDIDLSAAFFDENWRYIDVISYYNLKSFGGHHSGDIVDAPYGASEFIDVSRAKLRAKNVRFVVMSINSFTTQPFCDLPECFAGWMARTKPNSGEIFEAKTVRDRVDLASQSTICLPAVFDVEANQAIWLDIALKREPQWNNVQNNLSGVSLMARALSQLQKPALFDLFALHIEARGTRVDSPESAQTVFSVETGITPFDLTEIAANWL